MRINTYTHQINNSDGSLQILPLKLLQKYTQKEAFLWTYKCDLSKEEEKEEPARNLGFNRNFRAFVCWARFILL